MVRRMRNVHERLRQRIVNESVIYEREVLRKGQEQSFCGGQA
jgi:hypothetical protein